MPDDDIIEFIDQLWPLKSDMCSPLLKVFDGKHLILVTVTVPVGMDMIVKTAGNVSAVVGHWFSVKDHQHSLKVS